MEVFMTFIKKYYAILAAASLIILNAALTYFEVLIPVWAIWLLIIAIFSFVSWQIVKTFKEEWDKAKKKKERNHIVILGCVVGVLGVGIFCAVHFSGLSQKLFPG
jgi:hypothetical protein